MNEPRGFNPVGDHAPGLPQHDRRLPGHVPSANAPVGENQQIDGGMPLRQAYTGPALPIFMSPWFARCAFFGWVYLTAPIEAGLYPIAGAAGILWRDSSCVSRWGSRACGMSACATREQVVCRASSSRLSPRGCSTSCCIPST